MEKTLIIENKIQTKMIAHRGLSGVEIENTMPAFLLAAQHSYYGIETDVHRTKDGFFVIHHDDDLLCIYDSPLVIKENDLETLKERLSQKGSATR